MQILKGFPEHQRAEVAGLFWQAFSGKLGRVMAPKARALDFIEHALCPDNAFSAQSHDGRLLGVAGFKTARGGLVAGAYSQLARSYGWFGALWRGSLLDVMDRPLAPGQMLIDGLFVAEAARGLGVGTALIEAVVAEALRCGMQEVRLEVVEGNDRARALRAARLRAGGRVPARRLLAPVRLQPCHHDVPAAGGSRPGCRPDDWPDCWSDYWNVPDTRPTSMKARAVRVSAKAAIASSLASVSNREKVVSKRRRKWWATSRNTVS